MPTPDAAGSHAGVHQPLLSYARGHATDEVSRFHEAFLPTAHVEGLVDGRFVSWDLDAYCDRMTSHLEGRPAPDEADRVRTIDHVHVIGTTATATMTLHHGPVTFTDMFVLLEVDGKWRIANKVYHRHEVSWPPAA
ncbi:MAG: nuclear transport factor 2 family protein [Phycicoccus sp.]